MHQVYDNLMAHDRILPVLEPEEVAQAAINSILTNEHICIVPSYANWLMMLKA